MEEIIFESDKNLNALKKEELTKDTLFTYLRFSTLK